MAHVTRECSSFAHLHSVINISTISPTQYHLHNLHLHINTTSSHTTHLTHTHTSSHRTLQLTSHNSTDTTSLTQVISRNLTHTTSASGATFAWQVQNFESLGTAGARLNTCVPGAAFGACGATFAWKAQHVVLLELLLHGRQCTLTCWGLPIKDVNPSFWHI